MSKPNQTVAVSYLARGADKDWLSSFERFLESYVNRPAGIGHRLYVIFKGFKCSKDLGVARALFERVPHEPLFLGDDSFDIGAYIEWANMIDSDLICPLNTASEILASDWLRKLWVNLELPGVGLVGATASYESLNELNSNFPRFPNAHIRSTAFMVSRRLFCEITHNFSISNKIDAFKFESGPESLTRRILAEGKCALLVGKNGRGYSTAFWPTSDTFRQGTEKNLLIADNQTRNYLSLPWGEKREFVVRTWGNYLNGKMLDRV